MQKFNTYWKKREELQLYVHDNMICYVWLSYKTTKQGLGTTDIKTAAQEGARSSQNYFIHLTD